MLRAATLLFALACAALACASAAPLQPGDEQLVVRLADLEEFTAALPTPGPDEEKLTRSVGFDASVEIEYAFEPKDLEKASLLVYSSYGFYRTPSDAKAIFTGFNLGAGLGADLEKRDELFRYGDHTRYGFVLDDDGERIGTYFNMARGRSSLTVMIGGLVFDDPELWRELIMPRLRAIEAFEQRQPAR